jgi:hypothetical protein
MSTTTAPTPSTEQAQHIPLGLLRPSPTNPRKRFTPAKITELAESIKKLGGNFQPILARPNPEYAEGNGQPRYEIVAGERRWRACAEAGMPSVLALVRDISHFDCLEIQLVENIDREDLHPLEEAEGLKALLRDAQGGVRVVCYGDDGRGRESLDGAEGVCCGVGIRCLRNEFADLGGRRLHGGAALHQRHKFGPRQGSRSRRKLGDFGVSHQ